MCGIVWKYHWSAQRFLLEAKKKYFYKYPCVCDQGLRAYLSKQLILQVPIDCVCSYRWSPARGIITVNNNNNITWKNNHPFSFGHFFLSLDDYVYFMSMFLLVLTLSVFASRSVRSRLMAANLESGRLMFLPFKTGSERKRKKDKKNGSNPAWMQIYVEKCKHVCGSKHICMYIFSI